MHDIFALIARARLPYGESNDSRISPHMMKAVLMVLADREGRPLTGQAVGELAGLSANRANAVIGAMIDLGIIRHTSNPKRGGYGGNTYAISREYLVERQHEPVWFAVPKDPAWVARKAARLAQADRIRTAPSAVPGETVTA